MGGVRAPERRPVRAARLGWPLLIVVSVLIVLHRFWLLGRITNQHVDLLAYWLPRWCFLGRSVAHGHIPTWLPYQAGGVPFASDPQSGWLNVPAMALFASTSCTRAIGLMIVVHPLLAGLGMYGFFRNEGLGRPAATVGALTLALSIADSVVVLSMPFAGALAWTAMALWGASGYLHGGPTSRRLGWFALTVFSLGQVAAAHLTNGLLIGAMALSVYVLARSAAQVRKGERTAWCAVGLGLAPFVAFAPLCAGILLPRVTLAPRTALAHGYLELDRLSARLSGHPAPSALAMHGLSPWWGTSFARGPGGYVGAVSILVVPVALSSRRWRFPAVGFALLGLIGWALNLDVVVRAGAVRRAAMASRLGELWLRSPARFQYLLPLAFAALAGYGFQAWLDRSPRGGLRPVIWFIPSAAIFSLWPLVAGSPPGRYALLGAGTAVMVPILLLAARGAAWAIRLAPALVAVELAVAGLVGQAGPVHQLASTASAGFVLPGSQVPANRFGAVFTALERPVISPARYTTPGVIERTLSRAAELYERYLTLDPEIAAEPRGFLLHQEPAAWPAYEDGRSILFRLEEVQGYLSVQLDRYWRLVRRVDTVPIYYNSATLQSAPPNVLRLFGVGWMILRADARPPPGGRALATEGSFVLYALPDPEPRASVVFEWSVLPGDRALEEVLGSGSDRTAAVETGPTIAGRDLEPAPGSTGTAVYQELSPEHARIQVMASAPGLLVVRNAFDRGWQARVDGRPAPVVVTDYLMQGVAVPAGRHVVDLRYGDPWIGVGVIVSAVAWAVLGALLLVARRRERSTASALGDLPDPGTGPAGDNVGHANG